MEGTNRMEGTDATGLMAEIEHLVELLKRTAAASDQETRWARYLLMVSLRRRRHLLRAVYRWKSGCGVGSLLGVPTEPAD